MKRLKVDLKNTLEYCKVLVKWLVVAIIVGTIGGLVGSLFHESIEYVTKLRIANNKLIYLLPVGGIVIAFIYQVCKKVGKIDTNRVIEAARDDEKVPLVMAPMIFISTVITHWFGGSAGREGAALQLGGSIGYNIGKIFRMEKNDTHIIILSGMSSVFAALFGTPLTATFFALEVVTVGVIHYAALIPCLISSITAFYVSSLVGVSYDVLTHIKSFDIEILLIGKIIVLAILCALVSIFFCTAIKKSEYYMKKFLPNIYARAFLGGVVIVLLTMLVGTYDYNGAGMDVINKSLVMGDARPEAFLLKIIFTAITIAAGFKGGEIVPSFFVGSTFGCFMSSVLGIDPAFGAAIGFVSLFCGVVNCPIASVMLALEMFGASNILYLAVACGISFMMSGYFGLYKSQKIAYSKLNEDYIDINTK